jgi:CheY-like chemotaxis protein
MGLPKQSKFINVDFCLRMKEGAVRVFVVLLNHHTTSHHFVSLAEKITYLAPSFTAESMKGDREKCLEAGMNDYIAKPVKRADISLAVKKWCLEN